MSEIKMVDLPIFHNNDSVLQLSNLGLDFNMSNCDVKVVTFFSIVGVSDYLEDGCSYTSIHANGTEYICSLNKSRVLELIKNKL